MDEKMEKEVWEMEEVKEAEEKQKEVEVRRQGEKNTCLTFKPYGCITVKRKGRGAPVPCWALLVCSSICLNRSISSSFSFTIFSFSFSATSRFRFSSCSMALRRRRRGGNMNNRINIPQDLIYNNKLNPMLD